MTEMLAAAMNLLRRLLARRGPALSLAFLTLVALTATFAGLLPLDPLAQSIADSLKPPSAEAWFGTDELGRDILARVVYGARTSLLTAFGAVLIAALIGIPVGLVAGFYGDWRDSLLMRCIDVLLALPNILFAMALIAVLGRSQGAALIAVGIAGIPGFARIARAQVMALRQLDFVMAVRSFGGGPGYIMVRTLLPNILSPLVVQAIVLASIAILLEAALAFLGVGVPPPTPSWGEMLRTGKSYLYEAPSYAVLPGLVLTLTILSFDTIGRALTAILDRDETDASGATIGGRR
ncbi:MULTISPECIES: ABC transporter permease [unclassified Bosea (in: a-proteobacteria)]|uniref:ABC transporter permease n=1 Tax=unclassified Bosea (in: a-proteobacteria) TaxID=2653178 RepID=UPI000F75E7AB|nr:MULTISPECIES: ABC transporter permease [unclassified Bosea (in: a-proteobacteria)]AZO77441.1 peptide ABC transporter permease [Bosea sp. Tri-49]RXT22300.1 peptide ABC transporter permease [Bosea sp. Tri-39]RXT32642.1 peptide ABC transporter permease [Bosea sp. Tri-54]